MLILLSKLIPPLIYPLGLATILVGFSLLFWNKKSARYVMVIAFLLLLLAGNRLISNRIVKALEWQYLPNKDIPSADVIVVLGGGTDSPNYPRSFAEVNEGGDRLIYAFQLYKQGKAPHLLLSGGTIDWYSSDETPADDMDDILELIGIPENVLWLEKVSQNTYENAVKAKELLQPKGIDRIILVTSAIHMPRAIMMFKAQGFDVIPAPTDYSSTQESWDVMTKLTYPNLLLNVIPSVHDLEETTQAMKEYIGILVYQLVYR